MKRRAKEAPSNNKTKRGTTNATADDCSREAAAAKLLQLAGRHGGSGTQSLGSSSNDAGRAAAQGAAAQAPTLPSTVNHGADMSSQHRQAQQQPALPQQAQLEQQLVQLALLLQQQLQAQATASTGSVDAVALQRLLQGQGNNPFGGTSSNVNASSGIDTELIGALLVLQQQQEQQQQLLQEQQLLRMLLAQQRDQAHQQSQAQAQAQAHAQAQAQQLQQLQQLLSQAAQPPHRRDLAQNFLAALLGAAARQPPAAPGVNLAAALSANTTHISASGPAPPPDASGTTGPTTMRQSARPGQETGLAAAAAAPAQAPAASEEESTSPDTTEVETKAKNVD